MDLIHFDFKDGPDSLKFKRQSSRFILDKETLIIGVFKVLNNIIYTLVEL